MSMAEAQARGKLTPPPGRILFIRLWGLGDVLLTTPAVHATRLAYPDARIEYLTSRAGADALQGNTDIDAIDVVTRGTGPMLRMLGNVRRARFNAVVDFHSTPRTSYFVAASGAPLRIGFEARGPRGALYSHIVPRSHTTEYLALVLLRVIGPLGVITGPQPDLTLRIAIGAEERAWAQQLWTQYALQGHPVVALSPVSLQAYKRWAPERWAAAADRLIEHGVRVVMTHGPGEREQVEQVVHVMRQTPVWQLDVHSVRHLAALYERADVWLGNDGGAKHVAVAAATPTVSISRHTFGLPWTDPRPGQRHRFIERPPPQGCDLHCSRCPHIGCLAAITANEVAELVLEELRETDELYR